MAPVSYTHLDVYKRQAVEDVALDLAQPLTPANDVPAGLEGYVQVVVHASGRHLGSSDGPLYEDRPAGTTNLGGPTSPEPLALTLVPYFARGNRPSLAMRVWVPALGPDDQAAPATVSVKERH